MSLPLGLALAAWPARGRGCSCSTAVVIVQGHSDVLLASRRSIGIHLAPGGCLCRAVYDSRMNSQPCILNLSLN